VGADRRGTGLNEGNRGDAPSREILISDLQGIIENEDRGLPIFLAGWSWGAVPVVIAAHQLGRKLAGLIFLAPGLFPSAAIKQAVRREIIACRGFEPDFACLQSPLTPEMFSDREKVLNFIREDALTQRVFTPRFFRIAGEMSIAAHASLPELSQPVLLLLAERDETADNLQTLEAFQRLPKALLTTASLNCRHGMQFEHPHEIVSRILQWLQSASQVLIMKDFLDSDEQQSYFCE